MDMVSLVPFSIQGLGLPSGGLGTPRERVPLCLAPLLGSGHAPCCVVSPGRWADREPWASADVMLK